MANKEYNEAHRAEKREYDRKRRAIYRDKILEKKRKYYKDHREECLGKSKIYYKVNCEKIKDITKKYKDSHLDERIISSRKYYKEHQGEISEKCRKYRRNNPDKDIAHRKKQIENKLFALGRGITKEQELQIFEEYNYRCSYCGKQLPLEIDHIEPLSKGGADDIENATASCHSCNSRKGNKTLLRFLYNRHLTEEI